MEDVTETIIEAYKATYEAYDDETNEKLKQQVIDPDFDRKEAEALQKDLEAFLSAPIVEDTPKPEVQ